MPALLTYLLISASAPIVWEIETGIDGRPDSVTRRTTGPVDDLMISPWRCSFRNTDSSPTEPLDGIDVIQQLASVRCVLRHQTTIVGVSSHEIRCVDVIVRTPSNLASGISIRHHESWGHFHIALAAETIKDGVTVTSHHYVRGHCLRRGIPTTPPR